MLTKEALRVLMIEDNPADVDLLAEIIELEGKARDFILVWENRLGSGLVRLERETFDAVLLDMNLPDSQGLESIKRIRAVAADVPVLVMTGVNDEALALQAVQAGAQDYLIKGQVNPTVLERTIRYSIERKRIEGTLQRRAHELEALYQTSLEINAEIDLNTILASIVERASRLLDLPLGGIYLLDPAGENLVLSVGNATISTYIGTVLRLGEGVSGRVAQTGQPFSVEDYQTWEGRSTKFDSGPFRRVLGIPMKVRGKVIGVIDLSDDMKVGAFTEDEIRLVSMLADQAAMVVEKARLLEAERLKGLELERSNHLIAALSQVAVRLQAMLDTNQVMEIVGTELTQLGIYLQIAQAEPESGRLTVRYTAVDAAARDQAESRLGHPLRGLHIGDEILHPKEMLESRQPSFLANIQSLFSTTDQQTPPEMMAAALRCLNINDQTRAIHLPMVVKDHAFGALLVWGNDLRESDIPSFTVFANHVVSALENARLYNEIQKLAIMDELTGLYNRRGFFTLAMQHINLAQRVKKGLLLIFADIDGMKEINDTLGHGQGDQALIDAAEVLKQTYRSADIIARVGGDEFAILAMTTGKSDTGSLPQRLLDQLKTFNTFHQRPYTLSLSTGMAKWPPGKIVDLDVLLSEADIRMYEEKRSKKDRH